MAEARSLAATKYVPVNPEAPQDLQMLYRTRDVLMLDWMVLLSRIRRYATAYGVVFPKGMARFLNGFAGWLNDENQLLPGLAMQTLRDFKAQFDEKEPCLALDESRLTQAARVDERAIKLMEVSAIGKLTATASWSSGRC